MGRNTPNVDELCANLADLRVRDGMDIRAHHAHFIIFLGQIMQHWEQEKIGWETHLIFPRVWFSACTRFPEDVFDVETNAGKRQRDMPALYFSVRQTRNTSTSTMLLASSRANAP